MYHRPTEKKMKLPIQPTVAPVVDALAARPRLRLDCAELQKMFWPSSMGLLP